MEATKPIGQIQADSLYGYAMKSKPAPRKPRGVVARFLAGESIGEVIGSSRKANEWYYQTRDRVEAILRRALRKGKKRG